MRFKLFGRVIFINNPVSVVPLPALNTWGITNYTTDGYYLFFADYDRVEYGVVKEDVEFLQKHYNLGTAITRISSLHYSKDKDRTELDVGNYHIIGFTKLTLPELKEMFRAMRCDDKYKRGGLFSQHRSWVLRIGPKVTFDGKEEIKPQTVLKEILPAKTTRTANLGMIEYFEVLDGVDLKKHFKKIDKEKECEEIPYVTR